MLEFGEITRHKTLIFDLDETLIHSKPLSSDQQITTDGSFVIQL